MIYKAVEVIWIFGTGRWVDNGWPGWVVIKSILRGPCGSKKQFPWGQNPGFTCSSETQRIHCTQVCSKKRGRKHNTKSPSKGPTNGGIGNLTPSTNYILIAHLFKDTNGSNQEGVGLGPSGQPPGYVVYKFVHKKPYTSCYFWCNYFCHQQSSIKL